MHRLYWWFFWDKFFNFEIWKTTKKSWNKKCFYRKLAYHCKQINHDTHIYVSYMFTETSTLLKTLKMVAVQNFHSIFQTFFLLLDCCTFNCVTLLQTLVLQQAVLTSRGVAILQIHGLVWTSILCLILILQFLQNIQLTITLNETPDCECLYCGSGLDFSPIDKPRYKSSRCALTQIFFC